LGLIVQYIWVRKGGKHIIIIRILSFVLGMVTHSAMSHTLDEWLWEHFHFHDLEKTYEENS